MAQNENKEIAVVEQNTAQQMMDVIRKLASDPNADAAKARAFLDMQIIIMDKQAEIDFNDSKARIKERLSKIKIVKNRSVAYDIVKGKPESGQKEAFKYSALEDIDPIISPLLIEEKISDSYRMEPIKDGWYNVICTLSKGAYSRDYPIPLPLDVSGGKSNVQSAGSTNMYGRRYSLCGALGIVIHGLDDDGIGGCIDDNQAKYIKELLKETDSDVKAFLKWIGAATVEEILFKNYRKAVNQLEKKKGNKNAAHP